MVPQKQVLPRPLQLSRGVLIPFFEAAQRGPKIKLLIFGFGLRLGLKGYRKVCYNEVPSK